MGLPLDTFKAIQKSGDANVINVDGRDYTDRQLFITPQRRVIVALNIHTLQGVVDYVNKVAEMEKLPEDGLFVIVDSPTSVAVSKTLDADRLRDPLLVATYEPQEEMYYGSFYEAEGFNIKALSSFQESPDLEALLRFTSSLTVESSTKLVDDGVSQKTVVSKGVAGLERTEVPKRLALAPYRTFPEISPQPTSEFIVRLQQRDGDIPRVALFLADNDQWKLEAIKNIAAWIGGQVKIPIIA